MDKMSPIRSELFAVTTKKSDLNYINTVEMIQIIQAVPALSRSGFLGYALQRSPVNHRPTHKHKPVHKHVLKGNLENTNQIIHIFGLQAEKRSSWENPGWHEDMWHPHKNGQLRPKPGTFLLFVIKDGFIQIPMIFNCYNTWKLLVQTTCFNDITVLVI